MRITHNMIVNTTLRDLSSNASRLNTIQEQMSSTYRINRLSDDPLAVLVALDSRSKLYAQDQYVKNLDDADAWLTMAESNLQGINDIVKRMYELTIDAATDVKTGSDRQAIAYEIAELRDEILTALNATITDKNLFGGYTSSTKPFEVVHGALYYNGMNMYASEYADANVEEFVYKALDAFYTQSAAYAGAMGTPTNADMIEQNRKMHEAMETVISAARTVYGNRTMVDPTTGKTVEQSASLMITAMEQVLTANSAGWDTYQIAAAQAVVDAARAGNDASILDKGESMSVLDMMKYLEQMTSNVKGMIDGAESKANKGEIANFTDMLAYMQGEADAAQKLSQNAVYAAASGLAAEAAKLYEIEVGYGQRLNIALNGVQIVGTGDSNLYKVIDDLYFMLTREYTDTEYAHETFAYETLSAFNTTDYTALTGTAYSDAITEGTDALISVLLTGINMLGTKYTTALTYGREAQEEDILDYFLNDPAYTSAADELAYQTQMAADITDLTSVIQAATGALSDETKTLSNIASTIGASFSSWPASPLKDTASDILDKVQKGIENGMTYAEMKNALNITLNTLSSLKDSVDAEVAGGGVLSDVQAVTQRFYDAAAARLKIAEGDSTSATAVYTTVDIIAEMGKMVDDSWPDSVRQAAQELVQKTENALNAGRTKEEVYTSLWATKSALESLAAAASSGIPADAEPIFAQALSGMLTTTNGVKSGSIATDITPFVSKLQELQKENTAWLTMIGGRCNRVKIMQDRYSLDELNYTARISKLEDIDIAEAMIQYKVASSVYESSLNVGAKIMQLSLIDFMR